MDKIKKIKLSQLYHLLNTCVFEKKNYFTFFLENQKQRDKIRRKCKNEYFKI